MSQADPEAAQARRSRLNGIKLRALVAEHHGDSDVAEPVEFAPGAALLHRGDAWVLLDDRPAERLGAALVWALRSDARSLHVITDAEQAAAAGILARRSEAFDYPISVSTASGRSLCPAAAEPAPVSQPAAPEHEALRELIVAGGAIPIVEHGVLFGEVRGLEVCRVVDDPHLSTVRLEVGVGAHDREAFQMLHGDVPAVESLARIVDAVAAQRAVGARPHPLNRLAAERLLRWRIENDPASIGAVDVAPAPPPVPRVNLKDATPCVAVGVDRDGRALRIVCSVGADLDLIPYAADARLAAVAAEPGAGEMERLIVVTPARDQMPVFDQIAGLLRQPVELSSLD